jgi:hypothetical protein
MTANQVELQLTNILDPDMGVTQLAEAGVNAIHRILPCNENLNHRMSLLHSRARARVQAYWSMIEYHSREMVEGQSTARNGHRLRHDSKPSCFFLSAFLSR